MTTIADLVARLDSITKSVDEGWLILTGALVFFMQVGFAMLEAGTVRKQFSFNILFNNLLDACVVAIGWYICGFAFAFGDGDPDNVFIGNRYFANDNIPANGNPTITQAFWFFQYCFCATAATIVSGAAAERLKWQAYIIWVFCFSIWIYPPVAHWVWSRDGWMNPAGKNAVWDVGTMDYAGDGPVHMLGGISALVAAITCGYRGQYEKDKKPRFEKVGDKWVVNPMESSNSAFVAAGIFFLWFGWYGFNCGSTYVLVGAGNIAGRIAVNTTLAPASGAIAMVVVGRLVVLREKWEHQSFSLSDACNGALAGLVAITGGCAVLQPWGAIIAGSCAAIVAKFVSELLLWLRIDDPVDAVPIHLGCGIWGLYASALLAYRPNVLETYGTDDHWGLFLGGGYRRVIIHTVYIFSILAWCLMWTLPLFIAMFAIDKLASKFDIPFLIIKTTKAETFSFGVTAPPPSSSTFINPQNLALDAEMDEINNEEDDEEKSSSSD